MDLGLPFGGTGVGFKEGETGRARPSWKDRARRTCKVRPYFASFASSMMTGYE
jgi:hypothetical protein